MDGITIQTASGSPFVYEPDIWTNRGRSNVDLIVVDEMHRISDAVNAFDLVLCSNLWNGTTFEVKDPCNSFRRRTDVASIPRNERLKSYMNCMGEHDLFDIHSIVRVCIRAYDDDDDDMELDPNTYLSASKSGSSDCPERTCELISKLVKKKMKGLNIPIYDLIPLIEDYGLFSQRLDPSDNFERPGCRTEIIMSGVVQYLRLYFIKYILGEAGIKFMSPFGVHNQFIKGLERLRKYESRNIAIVGGVGETCIYRDFFCWGFIRSLPSFYPSTDNEAPNSSNEAMWDEDEWDNYSNELYRQDLMTEGQNYALHSMHRREDEYNSLLYLRIFG